MIAAYKLPDDEVQYIEEDGDDSFFGGFDDDFDDGPVEFPVFTDMALPEVTVETADEPSTNDAEVNVNEDVQANEPSLGENNGVDMTLEGGSQPFSIPESQAEDAMVKTEGEAPTIPLYKSTRQKGIPLMFAKTAKRVDVSKLKENLWHKLSDDVNPDELQKDTAVQVVQDKSFTHIVSELDDCYAEKQRKDISVAFCFICVLHLANENNLQIKAEGMKELVISSN